MEEIVAYRRHGGDGLRDLVLEAVMIDQVESPETVRVFFEVGEAYLLDRIMMSGKGLSALQQIFYAHLPAGQTEKALQKIAGKARKTSTFVNDQIAKVRGGTKKWLCNQQGRMD